MKNVYLMRGVALLIGALLLAGCGGHKSAPASVGVSVGSGIGITLTSPSGTTVVYTGAQIQIDATVTGDANNQGVTWTLSGPGQIVSSTSTTLLYQAPSGVLGSEFATLTATSVTDPTQISQVTITIDGTPVLLLPQVFPGNQNTAYQTLISVAGGTAPYAWSITSGTLPPGLTLAGGTGASTAISGTPTAAGTSTVTVQVTDYTSLTASASFTIVINGPQSCLLNGPYAYFLPGWQHELPTVRAGSFSVNAATGEVSGEFDYKDSTQTRIATALAPSSGNICKTTTQNYGKLPMSSSKLNENFDFVTGVSLASGHMQQDDGTGVLAAGPYVRQDPTAFSLTALAGDWVFGVVGDDGETNRLAVIGRLTFDATGTVSNGVADSYAVTPLVGGTLTGAVTAPDANGRGTVTLAATGLSLPMAYYVVNANLAYLVSNDAATSTPRVVGRMTRQAGAGLFNNSVLANPAVFSLWGSAYQQKLPVATVSVGLWSGAAQQGLPIGLSGSGNANAGQINWTYDIADRGALDVNHSFASQPYNVSPYGRGLMQINGSGISRSFVFYGDGSGGGYLLEPGSVTGNFGIFEPQSGAPFSTFPITYYLGGTLFAGTTSPISTLSQLLFENGSVSGNLSGSYAINPVTGRIIASVSRTLLGGSDVIAYIVTQNHLVAMGDSLNSTNSQIAWFESY